jgi:hypothetical protein
MTELMEWDAMNFIINDLVGGLEHDFDFRFHIWDVVLPIDELIFFKMVFQPPTSD